MVQDVVDRKLTLHTSSAAHGVSVPTVRKWVGRYLAQGLAGLRDASSPAARKPARDRARHGVGDCQATG
jgi:hypothetical protein